MVKNNEDKKMKENENNILLFNIRGKNKWFGYLYKKIIKLIAYLKVNDIYIYYI